MTTLKDVKGYLKNNDWEALDNVNNLKEIINRRSLYHLTLLHDVIKSKNRSLSSCCNNENNLFSKGNIIFLIEKGADLEAKEINGNTPLHTAVTENVDKSILTALIYTKHWECGDSCNCGFKALHIKNKSDKTPIELEYINKDNWQLLYMEGSYISIYNLALLS